MIDAYASGRQIHILVVDDRPEDQSSEILLWIKGADKWCGVLLIPGGVWPRLAFPYVGKSVDEMLEEVSKEPGTLTIKILDMPEGIIRFHPEQFLKKAESQLSAGERTATLTLDSAAGWGYIPKGESHA